ncbi:hypothetical protein SVAN01_11205, partial [Stagonosporopsis vannaccii]
LVEEDVFTINTLPAPELVKLFRIPKHLLTDVYRRSNGFFRCEDGFDSKGHLESHHTWFRFLVKMTARDSKSSYTWHEMTFCSRWTPSGCMMLCIGVPDLFKSLLLDALSQIDVSRTAAEPYSLHVPVLETIVAMQDLSLWSLRDIVRGIEKDRSLATRGLSGFLPMHEAARHAIHMTEVLAVSMQTAEGMLRNLAQVSPSGGRASQPQSQPQPQSQSQSQHHVEFLTQMLRSLHQRSQSNKERLQNEVAQAHNMIAQQDSEVMTHLGEAAKRDSGAMRTIAVVSMAFLPPTFLSVGLAMILLLLFLPFLSSIPVSSVPRPSILLSLISPSLSHPMHYKLTTRLRRQAIFSMSFFNYSPPSAADDSGRSAGWSVSGAIWIYFLCAVPLTLATLGVWFWGGRLRGALRRRGAEKGGWRGA